MRPFADKGDRCTLPRHGKLRKYVPVRGNILGADALNHFHFSACV